MLTWICIFFGFSGAKDSLWVLLREVWWYCGIVLRHIHPSKCRYYCHNRQETDAINPCEIVSFRLWYDPSISNLGIHNLDTLFHNFIISKQQSMQYDRVQCNITGLICLYRFKTAFTMCFHMTAWFWCNLETMELGYAIWTLLVN